MKLRTGIQYLLFVPLATLAILGTWTVFSESRAVRDGFMSQALIHEAVDLGALVHTLQVERGQSAGFLASKGRNFADSLPEERKNTIAAHEALNATLASEVIAMADLEAMRAKVTAQETTVPEMARFYTAAIRRALRLSAERYQSTRLWETVELGDAIIALSDAKEWAGLQRAAGATGLGQGAFALPVYRAFVQRGAAEAGLLQVSEPVLHNFMIEVDFATEVAPTGVSAFRDAIETAGPGADMSRFAAPDWFAASTRWIEVLRSVELTASDKVNWPAFASSAFTSGMTSLPSSSTAFPDWLRSAV